MPNGQRPPTRAHRPTEVEALVKDMRTDFRRLRDGLGRLVRIEWLRFQSRGTDALFRTALLLCLFGFCFAASIAAAIFFASAIREGLIEWSHAVWFGNLGAGLGILAIAVGAGLAFYALIQNGFVRRAKQDRTDV